MLRRYTKGKQLQHSLTVRELVRHLLCEVELSQLILDNVSRGRFPEQYDHFNPIRIIMPVLETAAEIEFASLGQDKLIALLDRLAIPEPEISFNIFRHGLAHSIRPFQVVVDDVKISWAIPFTGEHHSTPSSLGISAQKLLDDLKRYLLDFSENQDIITIQTGLILIPKI